MVFTLRQLYASYFNWSEATSGEIIYADGSSRPAAGDLGLVPQKVDFNLLF